MRVQANNTSFLSYLKVYSVRIIGSSGVDSLNITKQKRYTNQLKAISFLG